MESWLEFLRFSRIAPFSFAQRNDILSGICMVLVSRTRIENLTFESFSLSDIRWVESSSDLKIAFAVWNAH